MSFRSRAAAVRRESATGAAVVEFVMISVLLLLLLFAVLQVAVYFYARNVAAASAADAARYAGAEDVPFGAAAPRAEALIHDGLDSEDADAIDCRSARTRDAGSGLTTVTVRCRGHIRLLFTPLGLPLTIDVTSRALKERR